MRNKSYEYGDEEFGVSDVKKAILRARELDTSAILGQINLRHKILRMKKKLIVRRFTPSLYDERSETI